MSHVPELVRPAVMRGVNALEMNVGVSAGAAGIPVARVGVRVAVRMEPTAQVISRATAPRHSLQ